MAVRQPNRAIFEHAIVLPQNGHSVFPVIGSTTKSRGGYVMKKIVRLFVAAVLLTCAMSTASLADSGAPFPRILIPSK
jgi:hypothetical protein